ncbi:MAG: hypothetical protein RRX95_04505 [Oscillospiraceae bacterium]
MNNFWDLVGFEYKKIFQRKSTFMAIAFLVGVIILSSVGSAVGGRRYHSSEEGMSAVAAGRLDKQVREENKGEMDIGHIKQAILNNAYMTSHQENYIQNDYGKFLKDDAYIKYVLPYENEVYLINLVYEKDISLLSTDGYRLYNQNKPIDLLTVEDGENFYPKTKQFISSMIGMGRDLSPSQEKKHQELIEKVKTPFTTGYFEGYSKFLLQFDTVSMVLLLALAICVIPIFTEDLSVKTQSIILSSRYGKNKSIGAKIFTGLSFTAIFSVAMIGAFLLLMLTLLGFEGFDVSLQVFSPIMDYPLSVGQAGLVLFGVTVASGVMFAMISMFLASKLKTAFGAIIVSFVILLIPAFFPLGHIPDIFIKFCPIQMISFSTVFSTKLFELFGVAMTPISFYPIYALVMTIIFMPLAYRGLKNSQVR